jgi:hypothetical protein
MKRSTGSPSLFVPEVQGQTEKRNPYWPVMLIPRSPRLRMNRFRIDDSFSIKSRGVFVFVGDVVEGMASAGMIFDVPEAGHKWRLVVTSIEVISTDTGIKLGLVINDPDPGYLPGLGAGWIAELQRQERTEADDPTVAST